MNKVINACLNDYENKCEVSNRLSEAIKRKLKFQNWLKSKLPQDEAASILNKLYEVDADMEIIMQEEYFEAGFEYGKSL